MLLLILPSIKLKAHLRSVAPFLAGGATFNVLLKDKSLSLFTPDEMTKLTPGLLLGGGLELPGTIAGGLERFSQIRIQWQSNLIRPKSFISNLTITIKNKKMLIFTDAH